MLGVPKRPSRLTRGMLGSVILKQEKVKMLVNLVNPQATIRAHQETPPVDMERMANALGVNVWTAQRPLPPWISVVVEDDTAVQLV